MIYHSNLIAPDLTGYFRQLVSRPMGHSFGHDVPSDWADKTDDDPVFGLYRRCGFWTHDEAAILYHVADILQGHWLDVGCHTGWTMAHIAEAIKATGGRVIGIDPMLKVSGFLRRWQQNLDNWIDEEGTVEGSYLRSDQYFAMECLHAPRKNFYAGICIDGDHEPGKPLFDAQRAAEFLRPTGVILFHDFIGRPVREAVEWLMAEGFRARVYWTPHVVALCWRGVFDPPDHVADPALLDERLERRMPDFDFGRCS